jgi:hypothetical protein
LIVPTPDRDPEYREELLGFVQDALDTMNVRGRQQILGPSEIGGCLRGLAWKMAKGASDGGPQGWAAGKGVVFHDWLDKDVFGKQGPRFQSNLKLPQVVPWVAGGTLDAYDSRPDETIIDFKLPGDPSMEKARRGKPPEGYYVQINAYGLGALKMGLPVKRVALLYLPMCGDDLHGDAKGASLLTWPFDPQVAVDHYREVKKIDDMLAIQPLSEVMAALPTKEDFCHSRPCWTGNKHPDAICRGHRKGGATLRDPNDIFG